jgi:hypothetical protein
MRQFWLDELAKDNKVHIHIKDQGCKFGECAVKVVELTSGGLDGVPNSGLRQLNRQSITKTGIKCFQKCSHKCSTAFAEVDDTGMICPKPCSYKGLRNGRYWT